MSRNMALGECRRFMTHGTRTGKLATVRKDGRSHVVPIWFVLDGDDVVFTTSEGSVKAHSMRRDPRVCLCVDDEKPPYAYVVVDGIATISHDRDQLLSYATAIGGRYMGAERAEEFGRRNAVEGEVLVRVRPTRVRGEDQVTD